MSYVTRMSISNINLITAPTHASEALFMFVKLVDELGFLDSRLLRNTVEPASFEHRITRTAALFGQNAYKSGDLRLIRTQARNSYRLEVTQLAVPRSS